MICNRLYLSPKRKVLPLEVRGRTYRRHQIASVLQNTRPVKDDATGHYKKKQLISQLFSVVPGTGLEPAQTIRPLVPETSASTNSAIRAQGRLQM